jgi:hypothetical protein
MDTFEQLRSSSSMLVIAVVGLLALFLTLKVTRAIFKFVFGLLGFVAIVCAVGWFFLKH